MKTELTIIPSGMTSLLQPLDASINKPFKCKVCAQWNQWLSRGAQVHQSDRLYVPTRPLPCLYMDTGILAEHLSRIAVLQTHDGSRDDILYEVQDNSTDDDDDQDNQDIKYADDVDDDDSSEADFLDFDNETPLFEK